ncbi:YfcC family protein [Amphibiibacter pelophylacis]|uniref:YfcC family protein n=1 Tax=Amphibiibacter pelophylacis TaxID=1799477 RepID=A0ACC6P452_9BURK
MDTALPTTTPAAAHGHKRLLHPVVVMLWVLGMALALTWWLDAGHFQREGKLVVPGTYQVVAKPESLGQLLAVHLPGKEDNAAVAQPASLLTVVHAVPQGLAKQAELIVMVMFVGGMFGVMRRTGVVDAGLDRLLAVTGGNVRVLVPVLMLVLGLGSTFMGFISEYLVLIPVMVLLAERLGLPPLFGLAVVAVAAKIGYVASVTNPFALAVAQPMAGVPLFSGMGLRIALFVIFMAVGILYVLRLARQVRGAPPERAQDAAARLSWRHSAILLVLLGACVALVVGVKNAHWGNLDLAAFYLLLGALIAALGALAPRDACDAFVDGMKSMMLAALLIGLASSVEIILHGSQVMDTLVHLATSAVSQHAPVWVAQGLMGVQMFLDVFIPSVSGKAQVTMPIIAPIAQLSGVSGQTAVLAFLLGGGLTNMITPTSGMLLAYLAAARVGYGQWLRFVLPLFLILLVMSGLALAFAVTTGY